MSNEKEKEQFKKFKKEIETILNISDLDIYNNIIYYEPDSELVEIEKRFNNE